MFFKKPLVNIHTTLSVPDTESTGISISANSESCTEMKSVTTIHTLESLLFCWETHPICTYLNSELKLVSKLSLFAFLVETK